MFHDSVRRCRPAVLLVLAALGLFGLGAGHLATRTLAAPGNLHPAKTRLNNRYNAKLLPDVAAWYVHGTDCVTDLVYNDGRRLLTTPSSTQCAPGTRSFQLILEMGLPDAVDQRDPQHRVLHLDGRPNTVYGLKMNSGLFFSVDPNYVYDTRPRSFTLDWGQTVQTDPLGPNDSSTTTLTAVRATLLQSLTGQKPPAPGYRNLGPVDVPFSATVTTDLNLPY